MHHKGQDTNVKITAMRRALRTSMLDGIKQILFGTVMRFAKTPRAGAAPTAVTLTLRRSAVRLIVMDTHQPEAVCGVRTPIVVRPEPDIPLIVGLFS
jgi:hypothetical protein